MVRQAFENAFVRRYAGPALIFSRGGRASGEVLRDFSDLLRIQYSRIVSRIHMLPIAIVDDSKEDLALLTRVLQASKILNPVHAFTSGRECIEYLDGRGIHRDREAPALLLVDLIMAPTSGIDVLRHLQAS